MKMLDTMPLSGSFIAVWEYDEQIWSDTFEWQEGSLLRYHASTEYEEDCWCLEVRDNIVPEAATSFKFIVLGE